MSDAILLAENLSKTFPGGIQAVSGLNLSVPRGAVYGLIGRNGAGKTTALRISMPGGISRTPLAWHNVLALQRTGRWDCSRVVIGAKRPLYWLWLPVPRRSSWMNRPPDSILWRGAN